MSARLSGAHALIAALELHGVDTLFGVPGHGAYPIYDALNDFPAVQPFVGRNEQGATFAAEGYARSSGRVAVATSVPKAGLTNAATGIWEATDQPSRMLFLLEADPSHRPILEPVARYYARADRVGDVAPAVHDLMWKLRRGRPGGAALEVPNAVLNAVDEVVAADGFERTPDTTVSTAEIKKAAAFLSAAKRPLIVAGAPASEAPDALTALAEALRAPLFVDGRSKGAIPDDHELALGMSWSAQRSGEALVAEADAILMIGDCAPGVAADKAGAALAARSEAFLSERLVHVDWDATFRVPARVAAFGHVPSVLAALAEAVERRKTDAWPVERLNDVRDAPHAFARELVPWAVPVWEHLREVLPRDALIFTDSLIGLWTARLLPVYTPNALHFPWGTGTLGHAVPAALGAGRAFPGRTLVAIAGDGAFLYNPQELATMMLYRQKLILLIANDDCYGAVLHNMSRMFGRSIAHELRNPDFLSFGHAFDMASTRLRSLDELPTALTAALEGERSALIEMPLELRPPRY